MSIMYCVLAPMCCSSNAGKQHTRTGYVAVKHLLPCISRLCSESLEEEDICDYGGWWGFAQRYAFLNPSLHRDIV